MRRLPAKLKSIIQQNDYNLVFLGIGLLIGIGQIFGQKPHLEAAIDYSNKIFESIIPILLIQCLGGFLLVTGIILLLANRVGWRIRWLYGVSQPVLRVFNDFCGVFIYVMAGLSCTAFYYYFPFESDALTKSMMQFIFAMLGMYSFNLGVQNLIHGSVCASENPAQAITAVKWLGGFAAVMVAFIVLR